MKHPRFQPYWVHLTCYFLLLIVSAPTLSTGWAIAPFQQYTQAITLYRAGQYTQAYQQFSRLMAAHPDDVRLPYYMGLTAVRLGKIDQAKQFYETAIAIAPNSLVAPYAKKGLALLQEAQTIDSPPQPSNSSGNNSLSVPSKHNTLVAQWQKTHPATQPTPATPIAPTRGVPTDQLPVSEPINVVSTLPTAPPKEISISPAMLAVSPTGSAGVAVTPQPASATTADAQQQQQQLMQTMMMMQLMDGGGSTNNRSANPMTMMLPMMMMQQQQQNATGGSTAGLVNPFSGLDPKMMSDMMTQDMMNNLDLFSESKKDN
jgi:hypothetical protein